jgi:hypothetical protein
MNKLLTISILLLTCFSVKGQNDSLVNVIELEVQQIDSFPLKYFNEWSDSCMSSYQFQEGWEDVKLIGYDSLWKSDFNLSEKYFSDFYRELICKDTLLLIDGGFFSFISRDSLIQLDDYHIGDIFHRNDVKIEGGIRKIKILYVNTNFLFYFNSSGKLIFFLDKQWDLYERKVFFKNGYVIKDVEIGHTNNERAKSKEGDYGYNKFKSVDCIIKYSEALRNKEIIYKIDTKLCDE